MGKIQTIELFIKDEAEDGVFAISLVESPAIEENFVALSKDYIELKAIDDERRVVVGFALVPDKEIYRKQNGKEFNITFSKETVSKAAELYMKNLNGANTTSEHQKPVTGCCVIESWMVEDPKNDKSNIWNLGAVGGEWVVMMKIYNDEEYAKVKNGEYKGFSIEAMFQGFDQLEASKQLTDDQKVQEIKKLLNIN
jgi:hypothetical protein